MDQGPMQEGGRRLVQVARALMLIGVVLPLLLIGILKFSAVEVQNLQAVLDGTPWLAWLPLVFGYAGASHFLGVVELITTALFLLSPWSARVAIAAGALGALTFVLTSSVMLALSIWDPASGGFPVLNPRGQFLIKDVALLGISLYVLADGFMRRQARSEERAR